MKNSTKFLIGLAIGILLYYLFDTLLFISVLLFVNIILEPAYKKLKNKK